MALTVYGNTVSPFVRKVCVVLAEKGLEYTLEQTGPMNPTPGFLEASPLKKMPAFRDTSIPEPNTLADSSVICDYIEHKYPEPALYPKDPYQRARAMWFEEFADDTMGVCVLRGLFFERFVKKLIGQQTDEQICRKTLEETLPPVLDYLNKEIGDKQFMVGDTLTIADISIASMIANLEHLGEEINPARWPHLAAYSERLLQRPAFKLLIEGETPFVQRILTAA